MPVMINATILRGFGAAAKSLKLQMPHLIWQFPELDRIHTATINIQLEKPLRILKLERTTPPLPWWDIGQADPGHWHIEQFSIVPIRFEFPVGAAAKQAWFFIAHDAAIFRNPLHYEVVTEHIPEVAPNKKCKIHIEKSPNISVG
jgi:hypothetical protein